MDYKRFLNFCYGCEVEHLKGTVIVSPFLSSNIFKKYFKETNPFKGRLFSGFISSGFKNSFLFIKTGMGDRLTGDALMLLEDTSVERIIFIGACGGLEGSNIGDIVLCNRAFNGEGFSRYHDDNFNFEKIYNEGSFVSADKDFSSSLNKFFEKREKNGKIIEGDIFTIGSLLAETKENLLYLEDKGFAGIDMELSAVYHAAQSINKPAVGAVVVSDLPLKRPLGSDFTDDEKKAYDSSMKRLVDNIVEFVTNN